MRIILKRILLYVITTAIVGCIEFSNFSALARFICLAAYLALVVSIYLCYISRAVKSQKQEIMKTTLKTLGNIHSEHRKDCRSCPLTCSNCESCLDYVRRYPSLAVGTLLAYRRKNFANRQNSFLKAYPHAALSTDGVLSFCPRAVFGDSIDLVEQCCFKDCDVCRKEFWTQAVKEELL